MMKLKGEMVLELTDTNTGAVETVQRQDATRWEKFLHVWQILLL